MYYLTRKTPSQKWRVTKSKGPHTHSLSHKDFDEANAMRERLNAIIDAKKERDAAPVGRPALPEGEKAKRVFFTLRPDVWQAISPEGDAKGLKAFAKVAITEKLARDENKTT